MTSLARTARLELSLLLGALLPFASACSNEDLGLIYEVEAVDADGPCDVCDRESLALLGTVFTLANDEIVLPTESACLIESLLLERQLTVIREGSSACIQSKVTWTVRRGGPAEYEIDLGDGSAHQRDYGLLTPGEYDATVTFAGEDAVVKATAFSIE